MKVLAQGGVTTPLGYRAGSVAAGIKKSGKTDLALVVCDGPAQVAGAFTSNAFCAAPVQHCREVLSRRRQARALLVNAGNANACTGEQGLRNARRSAAEVARGLGLDPDDVFVFSTGIIGHQLPMDKVLSGIGAVIAALGRDNSPEIARAIMTTDTVPKHLAVELEIGGRTIRIGGMAKGVGMIAPRMQPAGLHATMLSCVTTDAALEDGLLAELMAQGLERSYNCVTVDNDTSTNDSLVCFANGQAGNALIRRGSPEAAAFAAAFDYVLMDLAKRLARDGEGATKLVEVIVRGARDRADARRCAFAIANSPLCKTAWFGGDANWGRVLCAAGYSGAEVNTAATSLDYNGVPIVREGRDAGTTDAEKEAAMQGPDIKLELNLGVGLGEFTVWTCDFSYEYVKINAEYHT